MNRLKRKLIRLHCTMSSLSEKTWVTNAYPLALPSRHQPHAYARTGRLTSRSRPHWAACLIPFSVGLIQQSSGLVVNEDFSKALRADALAYCNALQANDFLFTG